ncbi:Sugar transferase involved in LPS biosynthesis (colanic, teichoic acid) [Litoreibacter ascidiaceicola]|uniref:Sugar transferase involved in LPS biosynthesis (Colanic, teichoic acid) n=1 Tax=Litoreibacter ascidiaceicola TaxID=1486859 RepID=A0A1M5DW55_9RHOB|nr:sugar transferase [Litoreibacter ascidiaceicola]SHF71146.1 Sugar transferase involved in LPS biosynthesis (colanic, teichoic acid) [Litoreibacter ascidiaceicola]
MFLLQSYGVGPWANKTAMQIDFDIVKFDVNSQSRHLTTHTSHQRISFYRAYVKRAVDFVLILVSLPIILPLIVLSALLIARDGYNPIYTQWRVGKNGKRFRFYKFRTMVPNADAVLKSYLATNPSARAEWDRDQKLKNDPRIIPMGHFMRKTSLDELPQLLNVLLGDMALVGPRPMMVEQQVMYEGDAYYELRPGLTGLWQISDRNDCGFRDRVKYDDVYNDIASFPIDMAVIIRTFRVVVRGTGY